MKHNDADTAGPTPHGTTQCERADGRAKNEIGRRESSSRMAHVDVVT